MNVWKLVEENEASKEVKVIYDEVKKTLNSSTVPNWVKALGANPSILKATWEKTKLTLVQGDVSVLLKELIIFIISHKNGAEYCAAAHAHSALQLDKNLKLEDLTQLIKSDDRSKFPKAFQSALEIIPRVTLNPVTLTSNDLAQLKSVGFSDTEITELFAQGDLAVMFNTISKSFSLPIDNSYKDAVMKFKGA